MIARLFQFAAAVFAMPAKAQKNTHDIEGPFAAFLESFPADGKPEPFAGQLSSDLTEHAHPLLVAFWRTVGFGSFGDGFLHFFHPADYADVLARWLSAEQALPDRIPFARTAFGDLIYFRDLRSRAEALNPSAPAGLDDASDIAFLSVHHRESELVGSSMRAFFEADLGRFLKNSTLSNYPLYRTIRQKLPGMQKPTADSCYFFVPALIIGGQADIRHVASGDC
jgi:hypothetical protein